MTQVLFSFDTEDYTNPGADEAVLRLAQALTAEGVRGCFNIVGEMGIALEERGRADIIRALEAHEIDFHSWRHTWHPTVVEYGDCEDWNAGYVRFLNEERRASQAVKRIFRRDALFAAGLPGTASPPRRRMFTMTWASRCTAGPCLSRPGGKPSGTATS